MRSETSATHSAGTPRRRGRRSFATDGLSARRRLLRTCVPRHRRSVSTGNEYTSASSPTAATTRLTSGSIGGSIATMSAPICTMQISLPRSVGASGRRIQGATHPAATKRYRISPAARIQAPAFPNCQVSAASTSTIAASVSVSNRIPKSLTVAVRRATHPSTPSSSSATRARSTAPHAAAGVAGRATRNASAATSTARTSVI